MPLCFSALGRPALRVCVAAVLLMVAVGLLHAQRYNSFCCFGHSVGSNFRSGSSAGVNNEGAKICEAVTVATESPTSLPVLWAERANVWESTPSALIVPAAVCAHCRLFTAFYGEMRRNISFGARCSTISTAGLPRPTRPPSVPAIFCASTPSTQLYLPLQYVASR